jgi:hypothetical protein
MAEKFNMAVCTKIHDFLVAEPLEQMFYFLDMLYYLHCSIVKNLIPVLKNLNGVYIQISVENVYIFHQIFAKMIFCAFFFCFFIFGVKIKLLWKNIFLKIQNGGII